MILPKEFSDDIAKANEVSISEVLDAIYVFHLVLDKEYPQFMPGHPHLILQSDGSGRVVNLRDEFLHRNDFGTMFSFRNLVELVGKSKQLCEKHDIKWK